MAELCEKKDPLERTSSERDPVNKLMPVLRAQKDHPGFYQADHDLEQLSKARYFFGQVEGLESVAGIALRFKAFIVSLQINEEAAEEALKDVDALLEQVGNAKY